MHLVRLLHILADLVTTTHLLLDHVLVAVKLMQQHVNHGCVHVYSPPF